MIKSNFRNLFSQADNGSTNDNTHSKEQQTPHPQPEIRPEQEPWKNDPTHPNREHPKENDPTREDPTWNNPVGNPDEEKADPQKKREVGEFPSKEDPVSVPDVSQNKEDIENIDPDRDERTF